MVSLRRYLTGSEESHRRAVDVLVHGIVESAVCLNPAEQRAFSDKITALAASAPVGCAGDAVLVMSASAVQALHEYNARLSGLLRAQVAEFRNIMSMLAQTVTTISGGSVSGETGGTVESLNDLRRMAESSAALEDIQKLRAGLGDCLRSVCEEVQRRKAASDKLAADLQRQLERSGGSRFVPDDDSATGLPRRKSAEEAIRQAVMIPGRKYLVTAVLDRLQSLNARFGQEVGDRVLRALAERLKLEFDDSDVLFRWSGPTIVVLTWREDTIEQVRKWVRNIFESPFEKEFDIGGRKVLIPLTAAWSVIGLIPPAVNSFNYVDRFVASQSPKDYV